jgi:hypothetical protein
MSSWALIKGLGSQRACTASCKYRPASVAVDSASLQNVSDYRASRITTTRKEVLLWNSMTLMSHNGIDVEGLWAFSGFVNQRLARLFA